MLEIGNLKGRTLSVLTLYNDSSANCPYLTLHSEQEEPVMATRHDRS